MKRYAPIIFFMLIFSVFFSYKNALAFDVNRYSATGTPYTLNTGSSGNALFMNFPNAGHFYSNTVVWDSTTPSIGSHLYARIPSPSFSSGDCTNVHFNIHTVDGAHVVADGLGTNGTGTCDWDLTVAYSGAIGMIQIYGDTGTGLGSGTLSGDNNSSYSGYSNVTASFLQNGTFAFELKDSPFGPPANEITADIPINTATGVDAYANFTGHYTNDGTFAYVMIAMRNVTTGADATISACVPFPIGSHLDTTSTSTAFSCYASLHLSTTYSWIFELLANDGTVLADVGGARTFTTGTAYTPPTTPALGGNTCATYDVGCYIIDGLKWVFLPSDSVLSSFNGLFDSIKNKPPFGWLFSVNTALNTVNDTGTSAFSLQSLPILNTYFFNPIRAGLDWFFYFAFLFVLFHRFKNIDI